jgi:hypothetical protein
MTVHQEKDPTFTCAGCHSDFSVAGQIEQGLTGCGDCHDSIYQTSSHTDAHVMTPSLADGVYAYGSDGTPSVPVTDCAGCHLSNLAYEHMGIASLGRLPRYSSAGEALTCATCHSSDDPTVIGAIEAGSLACTGCHQIHEPQTAAHESTFVENPQVDCAQCHSNQLETEHGGDLAVTTSTGRTLTGCAVCHDYWTTDGPLGLTVQAAIEGDDQILCTACHAAQHPDFGSHIVDSPESLACAVCHDAGGTTVVDVQAIHADADLGACAVCHSNASRVGDLSTLTAECARCHAAEGADYHRGLPGAHTYTAIDATCVGAGCHVANTLPEEHERFLEGTGYSTTCALCHDNTDPARIDFSTATAACDTCHDVHGDIDAIHTDPTAVDCAGCHGTNVLGLHAEDADVATGCAACHNATTTLPSPLTCAGCHPVEGTDYHGALPAAHTAVTERGCPNCHSMDLKTEHFKSTVAVGCVQCHQTYVDSFTAPWDKTCDACHPARHQDRPSGVRR